MIGLLISLIKRSNDIFSMSHPTASLTPDALSSDALQPSEVLGIVMPSAAYVDKLLNDAILSSDPDKADTDLTKVAKKTRIMERQLQEVFAVIVTIFELYILLTKSTKFSDSVKLCVCGPHHIFKL